MSQVLFVYQPQDANNSAAELQRRLSALEGLHLLPDPMAELETLGGWRALRQAITKADYVLLLLSPALLEAGWALRVWKLARQAGVALCPLQEDAALTLPEWLSADSVFQLPGDWALLAHVLQNPQPVLAVPMMAPPLPSHYVPRRELLPLLEQLLDLDRELPIVLSTDSELLYGVGLRSLAAAACHNPGVQALFDAGIVWLRLGENPNLKGLILQLNALLHQPEAEEASAEEEAPPAALSEADDSDYDYADQLALEAVRDHYGAGDEAEEDERYTLLVLEDVHNVAHAFPFIRGSALIQKGTQLDCLILTHDPKVAANLRAVKLAVQGMDAQDGARLLAQPFPTAAPLQGELLALSERLGNWPIALNLARGMLHQRVAAGSTPEQALEALQKALDAAGLRRIDLSEVESAEADLQQLLALALDSLPPADQPRAVELGILPEGRLLPLQSLAALWQLAEAETLARRLDDLGLLSFDYGEAGLRLHPYLRDLLLDALPDHPATHQKLLAAWGDAHALPTREAWHTYAYHLHGAGQEARLRELLLDYRWLAARLRETDIMSLLRDFNYLRLDDSLGHLQEALQNAAGILRQQPQQLAEQLLGRLLFDETAELDSLLSAAEANREGHWLYPRSLSLKPAEVFAAEVTSHAPGVYGLALSRDGQHLLTASSVSVQAWDTAEIDLLARLLSPEAMNFTVPALDAAAQRMAIGLTQGDILLGDAQRFLAQERVPTSTLSGHQDWITALCFSPAGDLLVSACVDGEVGLWNVQTREAFFFEPHQGHSVNALALLPDGRLGASGGDDGALRLWSLRDGREEHRLHTGSAAITALALSPDGSRLIWGDEDGQVYAWDLQQQRLLQQWAVSKDKINALALGARVWAAGGADGAIRLWHWGQDAASARFNADGRISSLALSADETQVIAGDHQGYVHFLRLR